MKKHQNKKHFNHRHILIPLQPEEGEEINCKACEQPITNQFRGCLKCKFYLHDGCTNAPRSLDHLAHPTHPLTLLATPTYSTESFFCNACGLKGAAYSFSCAHCEFDLHMHCACMPKAIILKEHPHELKLIFGSSYEDKGTEYTCDVCSGDVNPENWVYYCGECDFGAHLGCVGLKGCGGEDTWKEKDEGKFSSGRKGEVEEEEEMTLFEAQKRLREENIAQQLMLQALDNASDYVGPSYTRRYYYYLLAFEESHTHREKIY